MIIARKVGSLICYNLKTLKSLWKFSDTSLKAAKIPMNPLDTPQELFWKPRKVLKLVYNILETPLRILKEPPKPFRNPSESAMKLENENVTM